jgi:glycosyltransferase involved in cell wall biosynthesis
MHSAQVSLNPRLEGTKRSMSLASPQRKTRLAIVTTHPIQYHSVWFRALSATSALDLHVWYCHLATPEQQGAAGFGVRFEWDVPLLNGYSHSFLKNVAAEPNVNSFSGLDTPSIKEIIKKEEYDAVLINGWHYKSAWQTMRACWQTKTPVMVRSDSHLHTSRSIARKLVKWPYYRWFIPKLDACLAVGTWSKDYFLHYGASPERVFIVPHVIDRNLFSAEVSANRTERDAIRRNWGLSPDSIVFLFAGKFIEKKRPFDFIKAIETASKSDKRITGLMVGDGPLKTACEDFVNARNLPVRFTGFLNQSALPGTFVAADALVLPSDGAETWGLVVNEAMSCGLPCFVSDRVGCGPDIIINERTGAVFPLGNVESLASLLSSFASDESKRERMSTEASQMGLCNSVDVAVAATIDAVKSVCMSL